MAVKKLLVSKKFWQFGEIKKITALKSYVVDFIISSRDGFKVRRTHL